MYNVLTQRQTGCTIYKVHLILSCFKENVGQVWMASLASLCSLGIRKIWCLLATLFTVAHTLFSQDQLEPNFDHLLAAYRMCRIPFESQPLRVMEFILNDKTQGYSALLATFSCLFLSPCSEWIPDGVHKEEHGYEIPENVQRLHSSFS